jgi:hypothetical protein
VARRMRLSDLPDVYDPAVLPDGTVVQPVGAESFKQNMTEVVSNTEAQRIVSNTRRKLAEMPAVGGQMNALSAVLVYTVSGLSDEEISIATGFTRDQLRRMRDSGAYKSIEQYMVEAVKAETASEVKAILVAGEITAAHKMVELVESEDHRVAFSASRDLLSRGGHDAAQKIDINAQMKNTFRIEVVDKRSADTPSLQIEHEGDIE